MKTPEYDFSKPPFGSTSICLVEVLDEKETAFTVLATIPHQPRIKPFQVTLKQMHEQPHTLMTIPQKEGSKKQVDVLIFWEWNAKQLNPGLEQLQGYVQVLCKKKPNRLFVWGMKQFFSLGMAVSSDSHLSEAA